MKLILNILTIFCLYITSALGQAAHIGFPLPGDTLHFDKNFTLQLVRPNSIMGSIEVGIAVGLLPCPLSQEPVCPPPTSQLGYVLYTGPFSPTINPIDHKVYENFTLTVPEEFFYGPGRAQLAVVRFHLIGGGPVSVLEVNKMTLNVSA
ncbi:hypothetical protein C8R47DRAFT_1170966 [Mycena vitilis]|nr:hypothetical protein C8R47DRAFT_1170966 [Mycena vitilis]